MTPDVDRVLGRIEEIFALAPGPNGGASRPAFSGAEARAMLLVAGWAREAGLEAAVDSRGNLWCLPPGDAPCVTGGSHVDTVPDGGRYDGPLGTVLAVEAAARVGGNRGVLVFTILYSLPSILSFLFSVLFVISVVNNIA